MLFRSVDAGSSAVKGTISSPASIVHSSPARTGGEDRLNCQPETMLRAKDSRWRCAAGALISWVRWRD